MIMTVPERKQADTWQVGLRCLYANDCPREETGRHMACWFKMPLW